MKSSTKKKSAKRQEKKEWLVTCGLCSLGTGNGEFTIRSSQTTNHNLSGTAAKIHRIFGEVRDLVIAKNADYGDSAFESPVLCPELDAGTAIRVRMSDKLKRIIQLENSPAQVKNESLADSYRDLIGYAVLRLVEVEENREGKME